MGLNGQQLAYIRDALLDAYTTREALAMMLRVQMDVHLDFVAGGENLRLVVFNLVSWAEKSGRIDELILAASKETPGNPKLQDLVEWWSRLTRSGVNAAPPAAWANVSSGPVSIDVFLSHSRHDGGAMVQVRETLRADGLSVWTDEGLEPGSLNWQNDISEAIHQARAFLVLLSPNAKDSIWVNREIYYALAHNKRIFPILIAGNDTTAVPISLITVQRVDGQADLHKAVVQGLLPSLRRHLGYGGTSPSPSIITPARVQSRTRYLQYGVIGLIGFLLLFLVARLLWLTQQYSVVPAKINPTLTLTGIAHTYTPATMQVRTIMPTTEQVRTATPTTEPVRSATPQPTKAFGVAGTDELTSSMFLELPAVQEIDGYNILVSRVNVPHGGWLVIHADDGDQIGDPINRRQVGTYLEPGYHEAVDFRLEEFMGDERTLWALLYKDGGKEDGAIEYLGADTPFRSSDSYHPVRFQVKLKPGITTPTPATSTFTER